MITLNNYTVCNILIDDGSLKIFEQTFTSGMHNAFYSENTFDTYLKNFSAWIKILSDLDKIHSLIESTKIKLRKALDNELKHLHEISIWFDSDNPKTELENTFANMTVEQMKYYLEDHKINSLYINVFKHDISLKQN